MQGKVVLITGAARGIGAETARRLAASGAKLALVGLEGDELQAVAASCGGDTLAIEADITDLDAMERAMAQTAERFGRIDVVFQNAGIASGGTLSLIDPGAMDRQIEVNVLGSFRVARAAVPHLERSGGYLLINASIAALASTPGLGAYTMSKHATEALANTLRVELEHHGIGVGCLYVTWIDTSMVRGGEEHPGFRRLRESLRPPMKKTYPVAVAADAVVRGIAKRKRVVVAPRWVRMLLPLRALLPKLSERDQLKVAPDVERLFAEEIAERGAEETSRPVGAGGAAAATPARLP
jgi:NAD(P)-dependent dehydrogenase (short-subunit alcohol dehydrogenase family)